MSPETIYQALYVQALVETVAILPDHLRGSLTWDQGAEMAAHRSFTLAAGMPVHFCDDTSPLESALDRASLLA